ncbi:hypothetical protein KPL37_18270 [Clostridium frigoris]|uniref:Uncharacterized protein n=1 Tax=Clostridium frigoris TaxID=205327 RepID=A0ABS6BYJ8_9CLOT|nr:hypothetical protein [Clostridium frigoris]MBU3161646.1 hypothetical protein [Clostridium frigoris]
MGEDTLFKANKLVGIMMFNEKLSDYLEREKLLPNNHKGLYHCDDIKRIVSDIISESTLEDFHDWGFGVYYGDCDIPY